jgi:hypothetical protein
MVIQQFCAEALAASGEKKCINFQKITGVGIAALAQPGWAGKAARP